MRLLKRVSSDNFELVWFRDDNIPPYAILSHTWNGDQEVTFDELVAGVAKDKAGYAKIRFCAERASADGLEYFWVDTCCINKDSSAELSESINSMYQWYQQAHICYALLEDWLDQGTWADLVSLIDFHEVRSKDPKEGTQSEGNPLQMSAVEQWWMPQDISAQEIMTRPSRRKLKKDLDSRNLPLRWFTRGWTLQELLAPKRLQFFDGNWNPRGMKSDRDVTIHLSRITGIDHSVLCDSSGQSLRGICHGQRMSWAAYRETTRKEDVAYCLLGIFNINMPLLYGEGEKAFFRLQESILASSTDLSILAWTQAADDERKYRGVFAQHPLEFAKLGQCRLDQSQFTTQDEVVMTNKGVRIETSVLQPSNLVDEPLAKPHMCFLCLGCYCGNGGGPMIMSFKFLRPFTLRDDAHIRTWTSPHLQRVKNRPIYFTRDFDMLSNLSFQERTFAGIKIDLVAPPQQYGLRVFSHWPPGFYHPTDNYFTVGNLNVFVGYLVLVIVDYRLRVQLPDRLLAVVRKDHFSSQRLSVKLLINSAATQFEGQMNAFTLTKDLHKAMEDKLQPLSLCQKSDSGVYDHANKTFLLVEGSVVDYRAGQREDAEDKMTKAIRISVKPLNLSSDVPSES